MPLVLVMEAENVTTRDGSSNAVISASSHFLQRMVNHTITSNSSFNITNSIENILPWECTLLFCR